MPFYAHEYSKALGRTITYQDIPVEPGRDDLLKRGWPIHVVNHLAALSDLHRAGRFDRTSDERAHINAARAAECAGVCQEECGDIHPIGKSSLSVFGCSFSSLCLYISGVPPSIDNRTARIGTEEGRCRH